MNTQRETELTELLQADGKHALYQMLPPCYPGREESTGAGSTPRLDDRRYEHFSSRLPVLIDGDKVVDIGANIGYFSFRLASELGASVVAFEPHGPHARAMSLIREACQIPEKRFEIRNAGVGLRDLDSVPKAKVALLLNVLQHAGQDFDADLVPSAGAWRSYAIQYLRLLGARAEYIVFQLGYTWLGHRTRLCPDSEIVDFTLGLLREANLGVVSCGMVRSLAPTPRYEDYPLALSGPNAMWLPDPRSGLLARWAARFATASARQRRNLYRFAQRPLWVLRGRSV